MGVPLLLLTSLALVARVSGECEDGVQKLLLNQVENSNLAGAGPDSSGEESLVFDEVAYYRGRKLQLKLAADGSYDAQNVAQNGAATDEYLGRVNLMSGSSVELKYSFVDAETQEEVSLPRVNLTFYALNVATQQVISASGYKKTYASEGIFKKDYSDHGVSFSSGNPCTGPLGSEECKLTFYYTQASEIRVTLSAPGVRGFGHLFYFSGSFCNSMTIPSAKCYDDVCPEGYTMKPGALGMSCVTEVCDTSECCDMKPNSVVYPLVQSCHGMERTWRKCPNLPECHECYPIDCVFHPWTEWVSVGGCSGLCERTRYPGHNNECGNPCSGHTKETVVRLDDPLCYPPSCIERDRDCVWGAWEEWSSCKHLDECSVCQLSQRYRSRQILVDATGLGSPCIGAWNETRPCQASHAIDCELSEWAEWTCCSKSCGTGWQARMRRVIQEAMFGGRPCAPEYLDDHGLVVRQTQPCNQDPCDSPVPCVLSDWSSWEGCSHMSPYQKFRFRDVLQTEMNGGKVCDVDLNQTAGCPEPPWDLPKPSCEMSMWSEWTDCSATCGGQKHRSRSILGEGLCVLGGQASRVGAILGETEGCGHRECNHGSCRLSLWTEWSPCTSECGIGATQRNRKILEIGDTLGCNTALEEVKACEDRQCEGIDCVWGTWEEWSACTCTCGGGIKRRNRVIAVSPRNGGRLCAAHDKYEVSPCNTQSCDECIDGQWSMWGQWGQCSSHCLPAYRVRHRNVEQHPNSCGKPATGVEDDYQLCDTLGMSSCVPNVDCRLSSWGTWSDCSCKCFGVQERQRNVAQFARGSGNSCLTTSLKEVRACNPGVGQDPPYTCKPEDPKTCVIASWEQWTECSRTCGGGHRSRVRHILSPAANGGAACNDSLAMMEPCAEEPCGHEVCIDCLWEAWSEWGACTQCGNQRFRHRNIARVPNHCGKPCDAKAAKELGECESHCDKKYYCVWSEWEGMGSCSRTCGSGTRMRQRQLTLEPDKPFEDRLFFETTVDSSCSGSQIFTETCELPSCEACIPEDCIFNEWSDWSGPTCTQLCERHRTVNQESSCGGKLCQGPLMETKRCPHHCNKPIDCVFGDWSDWRGDCLGAQDQRYMLRAIEQPAVNGGAQCEGATKKTSPCGGDHRNCKIGVWAAWSTCTASCDGGVMTRSREIDKPARGGGTPCHDWLSEAVECNTHPCHSGARDCILGQWNAWTSCQDGPMKFRYRRITQQPANTGLPCVGSLREVVSCMARVDCEVSSWTEWDQCDKTCGGGQQMRHRQVTKNPTNGGKPCPMTLIETQGCALAPCRKRDCTVYEWSEWSGCSSSCGVGYRTRERDFSQRPCEGGRGCDLDLSMVEPCYSPDCDCTDCLWDHWTEWTICDKSCDGGQTSRSRKILQKPKPGCKSCDALPSSQVKPCNTQSCSHHVCIDGRWGDWSEWSVCSATCEGGETWRHRHIAVEANDCGLPATGYGSEAKLCNEHVHCIPSVDCVFSSWRSWSDCSGQCEGVRERERTIAVPGKGAGLYCAGPMKQTAPCHNGGGLLDTTDPTCYLDMTHLRGLADPGMSQTMRFRSVAELPTASCPFPSDSCPGKWVDLEVSPGSPYQTCITDDKSYEGSGFGEINIAGGSAVIFKFSLVDPVTHELVHAPKLMLKFYGLTVGAASEAGMSIFATGYEDYFLSQHSTIAVAAGEGGGTFAAGDSGTRAARTVGCYALPATCSANEVRPPSSADGRPIFVGLRSEAGAESGGAPHTPADPTHSSMRFEPLCRDCQGQSDAGSSGAGATRKLVRGLTLF